MGKKAGGKQASKEAKKLKQASKASKKALKELGEEVPIEELINQLDAPNKQSAKTTETALTTPPSARTSFSFLSGRGAVFYIYGGEYFDSKTCHVFRDLYKWTVGKEDSWKLIKSNPEPKPRCGHQAIVNQDEILLFGGEYATASQFYHFKDFWRFDMKSQLWEEITPTGTPPSARSGHRMVMCRGVLVLFGGFHESSRETRYFNDVYLLDRLHWRKVAFPPGSSLPSARSGVVMASDSNGVFVYGGYTKTKDTDRGSQGITHSDAWWLDLRPVFEDSKNGQPVWERLRRKGAPPLRGSCGVTTHKNSVYVFGGVVDNDQGGLVFKDTLFFNDVAVFDMASKKWTYLNVLESVKESPEQPETTDQHKEEGARATEDQVAKPTRTRVGFIWFQGRLQRVLIDPATPFEPANETGKQAKGDKGGQSHGLEVLEDDFNWRVHPRRLPCPLPRMGASVCVKDNYLYVFGGSLEIDKVTVVLDDCWKIRVSGKKCQWDLVLPGTYWDKEWQGADSSSSSSDSESSHGSGTDTPSDSINQSDSEESGDSDSDDSDVERDATMRLAAAEAVLDRSLDPTQLPTEHETLREFYARTEVYWEGLIEDVSSLNEKQLRKTGFSLAEKCYDACKVNPSILTE